MQGARCGTPSGDFLCSPHKLARLSCTPGLCMGCPLRWEHLVPQALRYLVSSCLTYKARAHCSPPRDLGSSLYSGAVGKSLAKAGRGKGKDKVGHESPGGLLHLPGTPPRIQRLRSLGSGARLHCWDSSYAFVSHRVTWPQVAHL